MQSAPTLARFLGTDENRAALTAIQDVVSAFRAGATLGLTTPLLLHGPGGTGKTHLAAALIHELMRHEVTLTLRQISANDWKVLLPPAQPRSSATPSRFADAALNGDEEQGWLAEAHGADFLVIEDVQHMPVRAAEAMVQLLDARQAHQLPTLVTARFGPRQLARLVPRLGARLTARLAAGLVIALEPLQPDSRLRLLQEFAQRRQLAVGPEILPWLATHLSGGGRQLEGAVAQLHTLGKLQRQTLRLADIRPHFRAQIDALRPSVERIAELVGRHFCIEPNELRTRRRLRSILVPRQISMYLARRLTRLSFQQIGALLGGHDHSTVMHACQKIEVALQRDALLSGTVRQLHAELT